MLAIEVTKSQTMLIRSKQLMSLYGGKICGVALEWDERIQALHTFGVAGCGFNPIGLLATCSSRWHRLRTVSAGEDGILKFSH